MFFIHRLVIVPLLGSSDAVMGWTFALLVFAVLFITAAGYVINDYFDVNADRVNKPGTNIVGELISEKSALNLFYGLSAFGIISGFILSYWVGKINFTLIFLFSAGMLWYYSERYKCMSFFGNLVVSFLSALSFGLVWLFDFFALKDHALQFSVVQSNFHIVTKFVVLYMFFAFFSSLIREMIKDLEDVDGDKKVGCQTFVVKKGTRRSKWVIMGISASLLLLLIWSQIFFLKMGYFYLFGYFIVMDLYLIFLMKKLAEARDIVDYSNLSGLSKIFMLLGIFSMILVYFEA